MTAQRFADLLQYPHLTEVPDETEVSRVLMRYPYCQSFHILRAKMQEYTRHPDAKKSLHLAAAYSTDRTFLYHTMKNLHKDKSLNMPKQVVDFTHIFDEQVLILEEPPMSEFEILAAPVEAVTSTVTNGNHMPEIEKPITQVVEIEPFEEIEFPEEKEEQPLAFTTIFDWSEKEDEVQKEKKDTISADSVEDNTVATYTPDFTEWLTNLEAPQVTAFGEKKKKRQVRKVKKIPQAIKAKPEAKSKITGDKGKRLKKLIEKSIVTDNDLASETLADLLILQGKNKKAIKMYRQLSLKFPEKSAYFAAQIEKLMSE